MGLLKDASESLLNFSERFLDKTEELAQIARLTMEIKKLEHAMNEIYLSIGKHVYNSFESSATINTDEFITGAIATINNYKATIVEKQNEIQKVKELYESKHHRY